MHMQACEFDYSGTQACKALKCAPVITSVTTGYTALDNTVNLGSMTRPPPFQAVVHYYCDVVVTCRAEGYKVILINSNPVSLSSAVPQREHFPDSYIPQTTYPPITRPPTPRISVNGVGAAATTFTFLQQRQLR